MSNWYLSFDCATKTFAFSLSRIDIQGFRETKDQLRSRTSMILELLKRASEMPDADAVCELLDRVRPAVEKMDAETRGLMRLVDGATADLFPGTPDAEISSVERIRAVKKYVASRIDPAIRKYLPDGEPFQVLVEFQMGPNAKAREVAAALVTLFAESDIAIIGPSLKNTVSACETGKYCHFAERYRSNYDANKAHTRFNFAYIERVFGTGIPEMRPPSLRGHIADSFMQVVGYIVHGPKNASSYF